MPIFFLWPPTAAGVRELSGVPFIRALVPPRRLCFHDLPPPKGSTYYSHRIGHRASTYEWGGAQTFSLWDDDESEVMEMNVLPCCGVLGGAVEGGGGLCMGTLRTFGPTVL